MPDDAPTDHSDTVSPAGAVIRSEDLDDKLRALLAMARREGQAIRRANQAATGMVYRRVPKPKIDDLLFQDLRLALEEEVVPASPVAALGKVAPWELNHELMKKALVGLKASTLRSLAREIRVPTSGRLEVVATYVAQHFHWNSEEIARAILVAEGGAEPTARAHHDRLVPLASAPDLSYIESRLRLVVNRYIRVGVARWFVFEELEVEEDRLRLSGTVASYRAFVDETGDEPRVGATPSERQVEVTLLADSETARVHRAAPSDAKAAMGALEVAANLRLARYVPLRAVDGLDSWAISFDRVTLFMLDLLATRFRHNGLRDFDLKVARFKLADTDDDESSGAPSLEAVRFEGRHILDSAEACRLIATEGRSLVSFSVDAESPRPAAGESSRFPLHVAVDDWSVVISTGLGTFKSELSLLAHQAALGATEAEIRAGIADVSALNSLAERIADRATYPGIPERADLFAEPEEG